MVVFIYEIYPQAYQIHAYILCHEARMLVGNVRITNHEMHDSCESWGNNK